MGKFYITLILVSLIAFTSCKSKRLVNKATKFDDAGLYTDAAGLYYQSLVANENNIDAKLGLQRTGQLVFDDKIKAFKEQYTNGNTKDAVYAFLAVEKYHNMLAGVGVKVLGKDDQISYYLEVKDKYLTEIYNNARKAIDLEEFNQAESLFSEILTIDANYKDAKSQWIIAKYEPIYRRANTLFDTNLFRSAYGDLDIINKGTKGYKNSIELQQEALENAMVSIALLPMEIRSRSYQTSATQCLQSISSEIHNIKSPFYKVIDSKTIQTIKGWDQIKDADMAIQLAKKWGPQFEAKSIFQSELVRLSKTQSRLAKTEKRAYLKRNLEVVNPETKLKETKVVYDKVRYYEFSQKNAVTVQINYSLVRIDKDELGVNDSFYSNVSDEINYARFEGDYKNLVPGYWKSISEDSDQDKIYDDNGSVGKLHALFTSKTEIKSSYELEKEVFANCAQKIAGEITQYQPEN